MYNIKKTVTALALLAAMLLSLFGLTACNKNEYYFFLEEDMSEYITIDPSAYKPTKLKVPGMLEVDREADVKAYIVSAIAAYQEENKKTEILTDGKIQEGDSVLIWYRGQVNMAGTGEPEKWVDFVGGCNFYPTSSGTAASASSLVIGSGNFIKGFEEALIGLEIQDSELKTVVDRANYLGKEGLLPIAYIEYQYEFYDANGNKKTGAMYDRIDLTKDAEGNYVDSGRYSNALREALEGQAIGETLKKDGVFSKFAEKFDITGDLKPEEITIRNVKIKSIVKEETPLANATNPDADYTFELAFPNPYANNTALAGKTARWYVYAVSISRATSEPIDPDNMTAEQVEKVLGITFDLVKSGLLLTPEEEAATKDSSAKAAREAALVAHYREYIYKALDEQRTATLKENVINTLWEHIIEMVKVEKWPKDMVEEYVETIRSEAESEYSNYVSSYGSSTYPTLADYIVNYYSDKYFPNAASVETGFRKMAEDQLKQEMAIHYIAAAEGLTMSPKKQDSYYEEQMSEMLAYYNAYYASQISAGTIQPFTEADLVNYGYTKQAIVSNYYYEQVSQNLYSAIKDDIDWDLSETETETETESSGS